MNSKLSNSIKAEALRLGFHACGMAEAKPVAPEAAKSFMQWLEADAEAGMNYMANYTDKRLNPQLLMPGVRSIISVALNYAPSHHFPEGEFKLASYALGLDYHDVVKAKLRLLAEFIKQQLPKGETIDSVTTEREADKSKATVIKTSDDTACDTTEQIVTQATFEARPFVDTAPVLERYWAVQAGIGWIGRNHLLIIPHAGSMFFLGELFVNIPLQYDTPLPSRCGNCHKCIDACPMKALPSSPDGHFDAEKCLSYQLIENRGEISDAAKEAMEDTIYGCDRCQIACPWNKFATPNDTQELQPREELMNMTREQWQHLTVEDYRRLFKGSAVKRAKYEGLMRNITAASEKK